jgi:Protein of unknown function (DUF2946)
MRSLAQRQLIHWIAILAILMSAVAPSISQAVAIAEHGKGFTVEICSASGQKMVQKVDLDEETSHQSASEPCPYCVMHSTLVLPINTTLDFAEPEALNLYPQLFYQSPKTLFSWIKLPARAPPSQI